LANQAAWRTTRAGANRKSVVNEIHPRVQLVNSPLKILACSCAGPFERIAQFALQHADPRKLTRNPAILSNDIRLHPPDLQVFCSNCRVRENQSKSITKVRRH
jgi:hypothetical protein